MPVISTWADVEEHYSEATRTTAEQALVDAIERGKSCVLGEDVPPKDCTDETRIIHADFLRYFILGGCDTFPVRGRGVEISGAYIADWLDLSFKTANGMTYLMHCRFEHAPFARQTRFAALYLRGSAFPGLDAENTTVEGNVYLDGVAAEGKISFLGATIGAQLSARNATLNNPGGIALEAQGAQIAEGVFLSKVQAEGGVSFSGASIGGQLVAPRHHDKKHGRNSAKRAQRKSCRWRVPAS